MRTPSWRRPVGSYGIVRPMTPCRERPTPTATGEPPSGSGRSFSSTSAWRRSESFMVPGRSRVEYSFQLIWNLLLRFALIAGLIYCVYRVRFIIVTVILAALVAFAIEPLVTHLHTRRYLRFIPSPTR